LSAGIDFDSLDKSISDWLTKRAFESKLLQDMAVQADLTDKLHSYIKDGKSFNDFRDDVKVLLGLQKPTDAQGNPIRSLQEHQVETIFRTEGATASNYGRWHSQVDNKDVAPLWEFVYVHDGNHVEGTVCYEVAEKGGLIMPADWSGWKTHYPPNHFNCRSRIVAIPKSKIEKDKIKPTGAKDITAPPDDFNGTAWDWK
jgi:hypothetical protein